MSHIMLDLETLGTRPGFVVLSAALVRFDNEESFTINLSVPDQQKLGLKIDQATVKWWSEQTPEAQKAATSNPQPLDEALDKIAAFVKGSGFGARVWSHGASFDIPILAELFHLTGKKLPWGYNSARDTRTLYELGNVDPKDFYIKPAHVALNDAKSQTRAAIAALKKIYVDND